MTVVIDARFGSRRDILKDLKSSGLFEIMTEAKSLDDGVRIVSNHEVDACLLGPSVSTQKAGDFIRQASKSVFSPDCAFIAIVPEASPHVEELLESGAHGVVKYPCSKRAFTEAVVRAVVKANANSSWAQILQDADEQGVDMFTSAQAFGLGKGDQQDKKLLVEMALERLIERPSLEVTTAVEAIKSGAFGFDASGRPSAETVLAVCELANIALRGNQKFQQAEHFSRHLNRILLEWVMDLRGLPDREATAKLERRIKTFSKASGNAEKSGKPE